MIYAASPDSGFHQIAIIGSLHSFGIESRTQNHLSGLSEPRGLSQQFACLVIPHQATLRLDYKHQCWRGGCSNIITCTGFFSCGIYNVGVVDFNQCSSTKELTMLD